MNFQIDSLSLSALRSELSQDTPCELPLTVLHVFGMSVWSTMTLQWLTTLIVGDQANLVTWQFLGRKYDRPCPLTPIAPSHISDAHCKHVYLDMPIGAHFIVGVAT